MKKCTWKFVAEALVAVVMIAIYVIILIHPIQFREFVSPETARVALILVKGASATMVAILAFYVITRIRKILKKESYDEF